MVRKLYFAKQSFAIAIAFIVFQMPTWAQRTVRTKTKGATAVKPSWFIFHESYGTGGDDVLLWRVSSVDLQEQRTRLLIDIRNNNSSETRCFRPFDKNPLSIIYGRERIIPMTGSAERPEGVEIAKSNPPGGLVGDWCLQPNQTIYLTADFGLLAEGIYSGQVNYRDGNQKSWGDGRVSKPARFSLVNRKPLKKIKRK